MLANVFAARTPVWRTCIIALVLVGLVACQVAAANRITSIAVTNKPDCVTISVQGESPLKMTPIPATRFLAFQFAGQLVSKGGFKGIHSGRIFCVRYSRFSERPAAARIVVNTAGRLDYSTEWSDDRTRITINVWKFGAKPIATVPNKPAAPVPTVITEAPSSDLPVLPPAEISGPQGSDPGTPDPEPVKPAAAPMRIAGPASSAPAEVAEAAEPLATTAMATAAQPAAPRPAPVAAIAKPITTVTAAKPILVAQSPEAIVTVQPAPAK